MSKQFEYEVIDLSGKKSGEQRMELNDLGRNGWELISIAMAYETDSGYPDLFAYLKKEKSS